MIFDENESIVATLLTTIERVNIPLSESFKDFEGCGPQEASFYFHQLRLSANFFQGNTQFAIYT